MLNRQKISLALLSKAPAPLGRAAFFRLIFLLRSETILKDDNTFYDFVPYEHAPFSFVLSREMAKLRKEGYLNQDEERIEINDDREEQVSQIAQEAPPWVLGAIDEVVERYGGLGQEELSRDVYKRYPWFAVKNAMADTAVYTTGYEGRSVDYLFDRLLRRGIKTIADVRANPISRSYGFAKKQLIEISGLLDIGYRHFPKLGIPREYRAGVNTSREYQALFDRYEDKMLPELGDEIGELGELMLKEPVVLLCLEADPAACHRSRLAKALEAAVGLEVVHF